MSQTGSYEAGISQATTLGKSLDILFSPDLCETYAHLRMNMGGSDQAMMAAVLLAAGEVVAYNKLILKFTHSVSDLSEFGLTPPVQA